MSKVIKTIKAMLVFARSWRKERRESHYPVGAKFQSCNIKLQAIWLTLFTVMILYYKPKDSQKQISLLKGVLKHN